LRTKNISIQIKPFYLSEKKILALKWQNLENSSNCTVFLSWLWIGEWLELVTNKMYVIEAYQNEKIVGLGVFVEKERKVFGLFPIKQWLLHRIGGVKQDQIWIEYNDFLLAEEVEETVREAMVKALQAYDKQLKEVVIGLSTETVTNCFKKYFFHSNYLIKTLGYLVDLSPIERNYLQDVLSKNTRSQIKRSEKVLCQLGKLTFDVVTDKSEINVLYDDIAKIHIGRWNSTNEGSGFTNELFTSFHRQLVNDETSTVQIATLALNSENIGYLVNFVYKKKVYFYLSALKTFDNNKIKVGLTLHEKTIDYYVKQGIQSYDFLGGEARYKQSLSNQSYELALQRFYKKDWRLIVESALKGLKNQIQLLLSKAT